jgi:hypothetical protein
MLKNIYKDIIKHFGEKTYNDIESRMNEIKAKRKFSALTEDIENYIEDVTADKVVMITETTKRDIKKIVSKAIEEGKSVAQMEEDIDALYLKQIIPNRSKTIARTEVVSASNYGSYSGAKQTSSKLKKIWIPTFDDSTRETHLNMANHPAIGLDEQFNVGGFYGLHPADFALPASEVINCRCAIGYEFVPAVVTPSRTLEFEEVKSRPISVEELDNYEDLLTKVHEPNEFYGGGEENLINKEFYKKLGYDGKPNVVNTETLNKYIDQVDYFGYRGLPEMKFVEALKRGAYFSGTGVYGSGTYSSIVNKRILKEMSILSEESINRMKDARYGVAFKYAGKNEGVSKFALSKNFNFITHTQVEEISRKLQEENFEKIYEILKTLPTEKLQLISQTIDDAIIGFNKYKIQDYIKVTRDIPNIRELDKAILNLHLQKDDGTLALMLGYDGLYVEGQEYMVIFNRTKMIIDEETGKKWGLNNGSEIKS